MIENLVCEVYPVVELNPAFPCPPLPDLMPLTVPSVQGVYMFPSADQVGYLWTCVRIS